MDEYIRRTENETSLSYTRITIQPADKPIQHLGNTYKLLLLIMESGTEAIIADLISKNEGLGRGEGGRGGGERTKKKMRRLHKQPESGTSSRKVTSERETD